MKEPSKTWAWLLRLAPWIAVFGVVAALVPDYLQARHSVDTGFDFRVVYVAAREFRLGGDPYSAAALPEAYARAGFPVPPSFLGRMPVYPPPTLFLLLPLTLLGGITAQWLWLALSAALFATALACLVAWSERELGLGRGWGLIVVALCAASPTLAFALFVANVSVAAAALCIVAFCETERRPWIAACALGAALVLKPHLALWVVLGLWLTRERGARAAAWRGFAGAALFACITAAWMALNGRFSRDAAAFADLLRREQASGSMAPGFLQALPVGAQITSLRHLCAVVLPGTWLRWMLCGATLLGLACVIAVALQRTRKRPARGEPELRLLLVGNCVAWGLLATYHREHDALVLLLLLPLWVNAARRRQASPALWVALAGLLLMTIDFTNHSAPGQGAGGVGWRLLFYRQAGLGALVTAVGLAFALLAQGKKDAMNGKPFMAGGQ